VTAVIVILGVTVFIQNNILKDDVSLWSDNAEKAPYLDVIHNNLGAAYLTAGLLPEAYAELRKATESRVAVDLTGKFKTHDLLGRYYTFIGDDEKALMHIEKALKGFTSDPDLYNGKAIILMRKKMPWESHHLMKKAISLKPYRDYFHINLGKILLFQGYHDEAMKEAQKALMLGGDPPKAYFLMSDIFTAKKNDDMACHFGKLASTPKGTNDRCP
jgi:tetratricopeptide (TPR) repeat protein